MSRVASLAHASWTAPADADVTARAVPSLESGSVLFLPQLPFVIDASDADLFSPEILSSSKNTSFDPSTGRVGGTTLTGAPLERLRGVLSRYSDASQSLVHHLLPEYASRIQRARASFRPAQIAGRQSSWRKDDSRLHVDAFPASPVQGRRILRVFANVNPHGEPRQWRVGGDFEAVARRFAPALSLPMPGAALLLRALRVTKAMRTPYDALMLQLHDRMKEDAAFQQDGEQEAFAFPAGTTWLTFTDQVGHAAMSGQYQLEQTFLLPVAAMRNAAASPLRVLERVKGRPLV